MHKYLRSSEGDLDELEIAYMYVTHTVFSNILPTCLNHSTKKFIEFLKKEKTIGLTQIHSIKKPAKLNSLPHALGPSRARVFLGLSSILRSSKTLISSNK